MNRLESKDSIGLTLREGLVVKTLMSAYGSDLLETHELMLAQALRELREFAEEVKRLQILEAAKRDKR